MTNSKRNTGYETIRGWIRERGGKQVRTALIKGGRVEWYCFDGGKEMILHAVYDEDQNIGGWEIYVTPHPGIEIDKTLAALEELI